MLLGLTLFPFSENRRRCNGEIIIYVQLLLPFIAPVTKLSLQAEKEL